ncbi:hypothetical protein CPC735_012440 [Coccidioides posadasii C735 delta SOWgp]|uniref:Beta-lactamase-related domain-containing protein n=1 Tax=Coccidioides posadasii (strain C735) TaxID=222929 RepID=C5NZN3_COCP7|nr:hypothetical protein CPC735_012440 [Coccidioides posadasii C735 delta SOWgp]EER29926.1 hypothetical protein CPC735_012440 [Coccidioides posadasii C735 delta SOWgp]|eukprot:XP_003072071.1 hypothetical protein CPC735_012440 [Coccidioides posadasii C735 delta SOWgp]
MIFSLTKLMTSIAVLQCVERGLIQLDDDVAQILPDLAALENLEGHNSDTREWILRKRKNAINLIIQPSSYSLIRPHLRGDESPASTI